MTGVDYCFTYAKVEVDGHARTNEIGRLIYLFGMFSSTGACRPTPTLHSIIVSKSFTFTSDYTPPTYPKKQIKPATLFFGSNDKHSYRTVT
jgi:hypothetical protein